MSTCRSCGAAIIWTRTLASRKPMPVNADPTERGNVVVLDGHGGAGTHRAPDGTPISRHATAEDRAAGVPLYTSHFATCTEADTWRRK